MTTTMSHTAASIIPGARAMLGYGQKLAEGIKPEQFAKMPEGINTNHPAFCFGHLSIYPDMLLEGIGRTELTKPGDGYEALFMHGVECKDDPEGTIYPSMDEIMARYAERHETLFSLLEGTSDEVFAGINPREQMRDMCPTLGALTSFMLLGHTAMHCGQVSAWRRIFGLGGVM